MSKTHNQATEANLSNCPLAIFIKLKEKVCCQLSTSNRTLNFIPNKKIRSPSDVKVLIFHFLCNTNILFINYGNQRSTFKKEKFNLKISITS